MQRDEKGWIPRKRRDIEKKRDAERENEGGRQDDQEVTKRRGRTASKR